MRWIRQRVGRLGDEPLIARNRIRHRQVLHCPELRRLYPRQTQHRFLVVLPKTNEFRVSAKRGNKVVRPSSVKLYGASAFDVYWISHVEARELYPPILFDI